MEIKRLESRRCCVFFVWFFFFLLPSSSVCKARSLSQIKKRSSRYAVNSWGEMIHNPHAQRSWLVCGCFYSMESVSIYVCLTRCKSHNGNLVKACAVSVYNTRNKGHNSFQRYKGIYKVTKTKALHRISCFKAPCSSQLHNFNTPSVNTNWS